MYLFVLLLQFFFFSPCLESGLQHALEFQRPKASRQLLACKFLILGLPLESEYLLSGCLPAFYPSIGSYAFSTAGAVDAGTLAGVSAAGVGFGGSTPLLAMSSFVSLSSVRISALFFYS